VDLFCVSNECALEFSECDLWLIQSCESVLRSEY